MEKIITTGHYQSIDSLNSDKPDIIRILGPDSKKEGYWITQDAKSIPTYELENNWIKLYTSASKIETKPFPKNLLEGIGESSDIEEKLSDYDSQMVEFEEKIKKQDIVQIKIIEEKIIPFEISIIKKINIDNLNKKTFDDLGIDNKIKKPIIDIELPIEFNYDIEKLRQTIELLSLNENIILEYLINEISIIDIKLLLKEKLRQKLFENIIKTVDNINNIKTEPIIKEIYVSPEPEIIVDKKSIVNNEIEEGISEIQKYLNTII